MKLSLALVAGVLVAGCGAGSTGAKNQNGGNPKDGGNQIGNVGADGGTGQQTGNPAKGKVTLKIRKV